MNRSPGRNPEGAASRTPRLSIVIVNYDSWPDVVRLCRSLTSSSEILKGDCEVVVVDNASPSPPPPDFLNSLPASIRVLLHPENGGFAAGVNLGWNTARGQWILVLNPDIRIPQGQLASILKLISKLDSTPEHGPTPGVVGFKLLNPDGSRQPSVGSFPNLPRTGWEQLIPRARRKYQPGWRTRPGPVDWVTGACMLLNVRMLEDVGGMDEEYFLYHEEVDLCRVAWNRGWTVHYDDSIEVIHLHPLQNRAISPRMRIITRHSKLLYFRKHLPRWQFLTLSRIISVEARIRRVAAMVHGRADHGRGWRTIEKMARAFRDGVEPTGRRVLALANSIGPADSDAPADSQEGIPPIPTIVLAGKRRGTSKRAFLKPRKDGPACR